MNSEMLRCGVPRNGTEHRHNMRPTFSHEFQLKPRNQYIPSQWTSQAEQQPCRTTCMNAERPSDLTNMVLVHTSQSRYPGRIAPPRSCSSSPCMQRPLGHACTTNLPQSIAHSISPASEPANPRLWSTLNNRAQPEPTQTKCHSSK